MPAPGYYSAYSNNGYVQVSRSQARRGDIVQVYKPGASETTYLKGYHTAILLEGFGDDNAARFVDSNFVQTAGPEMVATHNWDPYARASQYGFAVAIWRYNG